MNLYKISAWIMGMIPRIHSNHRRDAMATSEMPGSQRKRLDSWARIETGGMVAYWKWI